MNQGFRNRKITANYYRYPHSIHRSRSSPHWIRGRQLEAATMKQAISEIQLALEDGDMGHLKETLAKIKSSKAVLEKRQRRRRISQPRKRLLLISAIEEDNLEKVKNLLSDGINCNDVQENLCFVRQNERLYAIHKATILGLTDIVEVLLNAGANPNVIDQNRNTPLHIAVNQGSNPMVRLLLSCGADPKLTDHHGNAAIHIATSQGHLNLVRTLIEFGADIHQMNSTGHQPVHVAAAAGHFHIIHLLCSADPGNVTARNSAGQCPLHLAAENGHVETVTALLDLFSADPNEKNLEGEVPLLRLLLKPYRKNIMRDMIYYYASFMALVQYGASLHVENYRGLTLLEIAEANQYTKIAELLKTVKSATSSGEPKDLERDENADATASSRIQTNAVKSSEESLSSSSSGEHAEMSAEVVGSLRNMAEKPSARENHFGAALSRESPRTDLCQGQLNEKASRPSLKHVSFTLPGDELNDIQSGAFSNSSHLLSAQKMSNLVGETCDQNSITESIQNKMHFPSQVTVLQSLARNELQPVQPHSQDSLRNKCKDVTNLNKKKQVLLSEDDSSSTQVPCVEDDGKVCEVRTGTVCRVKLEKARPDHYVIETVGPSASGSKGSCSRLLGRTEVDSYLKLHAELNAFDKDIGLSDEDFLEDFVSDSSSSKDFDYDLNDQTTLVQKQNGKMGEQLKSNEGCNMTQDFSVQKLVAYFEDDIKHRLLDCEKSHRIISSTNESKNEAILEKQKTLPAVLLCSDNACRPRLNENREICKGEILTGVDSLQVSDEKTTNLERQNVVELNQNENEVQGAKVKSSTDLYFFPSKTADLKKSQTIGEPKESARRVTETDDLLGKMHSENKAQVDRENLIQNISVIEKIKKIPSGDERSSSSAQALHWKENQAEADRMSCADIKSSILQRQSEMCTEFANNDVLCNMEPKDMKQNSKTKKKIKKKLRVNEDLKMTDFIKGSEVISTESPVDVRNGGQLVEKVTTSKKNELAATETQAVDCCNLQSANCITAREELLNGSCLSASDLSVKIAKSKKKKKKTKEGESVETKFMESTFDDDPAFDFLQQSAAQTGSKNTQETFLAEIDPSFRTTGSSSKDVIKQKKKKNVKIAGAIEFTDANVADHIQSKNCEGFVVEDTEGNWRRNLDKAPFMMHLHEGTELDQVDHFPSYGSGNNTAVVLNTQMADSKARRIRSELCSAFGISQDTNIDNDLMKDSSRNRAGKRTSMEKVSNWTGCNYEGAENEGRMLWPTQTALLGGKHKALNGNSEISFSVNKTGSGKCKPQVISLIGGHDKPDDGQTSSPQFSRISTSSGSCSFVSLGRDEHFVNAGCRIKDTKLSASDSSQQSSFLVQDSKETCIDDDFDKDLALEKIRDIPSKISVEKYCDYKETDVDEIFNSDDHQLRPEEENNIHASDQIQVSYMQTNNMNTTSESRKDVELSLPDFSSVKTLSTCIKQLSKKKKSQKQVEVHQNPNLESVETPSDLAVDSPSESGFHNTSECSDKPLDIIETHLNGSLEDIEIIDVESVSTADFDAAADFRKREEQEKQETVVENIVGKDSDQRTSPVCSPSVSEDSQTESDNESDSSDSSSGEFVFGQSRTLFTIKELNAEAEVDTEDDQPDEIAMDESTRKDTEPPGDDWDDFDLSELHTRPLEKIKLTAQTLETRRRLYEEAETDEEEDQIGTNANSGCLKEPPSLIIKPLPTSPPVQLFSASPPIRQSKASPSIQPCAASPTMQSYSASPSIQPYAASPSTQPLAASPSMQSCSASPSMQSCSASPSMQLCSASPSMQSCAASPSMQSCAALPTVQSFSASPPIEPCTASPPVQQFDASPSSQPFSASPATQPFSASPLIEPFSVTSDVVSSIPEQDCENPVHGRDVLLPLQEHFSKEDTTKIVKVRQSKKKKRSARSFIETSFDDMEPVSLSMFEVGTSTENRTDIVQDDFLDGTTFHTSSIDKPPNNCELSEKFTISVEKPCVEQEYFQISTASNQSVELKQEPFKKTSKHSQKGVKVELSELIQDSLNDNEDTHQTITYSKRVSEEEQELNKETEDLEDVDIALSQPCKDRWIENEHISEERKIKPKIPTKKLNEDDLVSENVEKEDKGKLTAHGVDDEMVVSGSFSRQQIGRVSRARQKKGTRRPISVTSDRRPALVFENPPANSAISGVASNEISCDRKNAEYFDNKNASKSESTSLSSSFEKVETSSKEFDGNSRKSASESVSEVITLKKKEMSGKPPLPRAADSRVLAEGSNRSSSEIQGNTFHAVQATKHRMLNALPNVRDPKMLSSKPAASTIQQQRMGSKRTFPQNVYRGNSSFEENSSHLRRPSGKSAGHSSFERPRSAEGVLSDTHLILPHSVVSQSAQRQMHQQPMSRKVLSSEDIRRRQMKNLNTEERLEPIAVKPPQKTLQEAAFEAITAGMLSQSKLQPRRTAKPDNGPVTYVQGVYRPHPVVFRGSLSAGSGFDDSQASSDLGYRPSSGSGNESWNGNE